jgi:hypothetical protein
MSKFKVTAVITLSLDIMADTEKQALELAKDQFDIEDHLNVLDESIKFTKAKIDENEDEDVVFESYGSDDDEDEEYDD